MSVLAQSIIKGDDVMEEYPRVLNSTGCLYGQHLDRRFADSIERIESRIEKIEARTSKILWTMVGVLVALSTSTILLYFNLALSRGGV